MPNASVQFALVVSIAAIASACGARSSLIVEERAPDAGASEAGALCATDAQCPNDDKCKPQSCTAGRCEKQAEVKCDDGDPCTDDSCVTTTGKCSFLASTLDLDGDGHKGIRPGKKLGEPGACGDDCDDTRKNAFPGNAEVCDGVDNDCNGIVDDGAQWLPKVGAGDGVRLSSARFSRSGPGGLAHDGTKYFAAYDGYQNQKQRIFGGLFDLNGKALTAEAQLDQAESDADARGVVWTGDRYGLIWTDRRFGNYEIFFAMFDRDGKKIAPGDVRVTISEGFSISPSLVWSGREYVVAWQDGDGDNGSFNVHARRIDLDGKLLGDDVSITTNVAESPSLAVGRPGLGIAYTRASSDGPQVYFRAYDFELKPLGAEVQLTPGQTQGRYPTIVWNGDAFVVAWTQPEGTTSVVGATVDGLGAVKIPPKKLSDSPRFARDASVIPLGDRVLIVYADSRDQNAGFELYSHMLDANLNSKAPSARLTNHVGESTTPVAQLGPQGEIGVIFRDDRESSPHVYFTSLVCRSR